LGCGRDEVLVEVFAVVGYCTMPNLVCYQRFGTACRCHIEGSRNQFFQKHLDLWIIVRHSASKLRWQLPIDAAQHSRRAETL